LEPEEDIWVEWVVCPEHYKPEIDDKMIVEAAENYRKRETWLRLSSVEGAK
jgi:hypothetical protein